MVADVTDKSLLRQRLRRALLGDQAGAVFLMDRAVADLAERLAATERRFPIAVAHGGLAEGLAGALSASGKVGATYRLEPVAAAFDPSSRAGLVADEEALPLRHGSVDLFASALALQWSNDLPGTLIQIRQALRPDGLFLAALTGGRTLFELREAFFEAESERLGGAGPRVLPTADTPALGALLQRAGFALPVADRDLLTVRYDSALGLFADLKAMGATNTLRERPRRPLARSLLLRVAEIYADRFADPDGRIRASFELVFLSGWAPDESQPKPARRGSAKVSLATVLEPKKST